MTYPLLSRADLDFMLFDWLGVSDRETIGAVLDVAERVAVDLFLPHHRMADRLEPSLDADGVHILPAIATALRKYASLGLFAASFPEELGGLGLPHVVGSAIYATVAAANLATAAYPMLTGANARLIAAFGNSRQIDTFARPQIEGRWFGTMCLSEPQAGSSLADVRTRAIADGVDDLGSRYRLSGSKMWISGGDQDASENIVHLVLAKAQDADGSLPDGTAGLSLFIVPKTLPQGSRNDIAIAGLNHKLGYRGTANCLLNFGEERGAIGWRVGEVGKGLAQMFKMMNEARISVGLGAAAVGYRSYRHSVRYAEERTQGRPLGERGGAPVSIITHPDVRRMLLQQKSYVEGALALCLYAARLIDDGSDDALALLDLLTPVVKTWASEYGLQANDIAIQIHGGYGYTRDFDVEQLWRDNRLNPIHEGTTGIQAIDLLGRKLLRGQGVGLTVVARRIRATSAGGDLQPLRETLLAAWKRIEDVIEGLRRARDPFNDATLFLRAFGHIVVAWLWLDQAIAAVAVGGAFEEGKRRACQFFFATEIPQAMTWLSIVAEHGDLAASAPGETFQ